MKAQKIKNAVANVTKQILDRTLRVEANSTACIVMHQPKAPEQLSRFKNEKIENKLS